MEIIDETPTEFPSVTLCDSIPFTTNYSYQILDLITQDLSKKFFNYSFKLSQLGFYNYYVSKDYPASLWLNFWLYNWGTAYMTMPTFDEYSRKALGWDLTQLITDCTFNGIPCDLSNDFQWYFSPVYGNCYQYVILKRRTVSKIQNLIKIFIRIR